jgi:hypothetical protein
MSELITRDDYIKAGYRITSRKYGSVSRIDREDWKEYMAEQHAPWDIEEGRRWVKGLGDRVAADHYRRVYSKDHIDLGRKGNEMKIPNSGDLL